MSQTIAVVGASKDRAKFGNKGLRAYHAAGWTVYPVHPSEKTIEGLVTYPSVEEIPVERLDRVSLYVPPEVGMTLLQGIAQKEVGELWLNPGSESDELVEKADALGLDVVEACSIVDIGMRPSDFR